MKDNKDQRYLVIKAKSGLGNRILSAVTGLVYADLSGRKALIDWRDGTYAPAGINAYPLLFDSPLSSDLDALQGIDDISPPIWKGYLDSHPSEMVSKFHPHHHRNPFIYRYYIVNLLNLQDPSKIAVYWSYVGKISRMKRLINSFPPLRNKSLEEIYTDYIAKYFQPKPHIINAVNACIADDVRPVLGVHIRYTDLRVPLAKILFEIDEAFNRSSKYRLFLATDNQEIEKTIRSRYKSTFTNEKWFADDQTFLHHNPRNPDRLREAERAIIDMWSLSRCDKLIFSSNSTFSYTSKLLGRFSSNDAIDVESRSFKHRIRLWIRDYA